MYSSSGGMNFPSNIDINVIVRNSRRAVLRNQDEFRCSDRLTAPDGPAPNTKMSSLRVSHRRNCHRRVGRPGAKPEKKIAHSYQITAHANTPNTRRRRKEMENP